MKFTIEDLMEKLGVDRVLTPYETQPWLHYEEDMGITCSAEVRVGPGYADIETEIQLLYDEPPEEEEEEEGEEQIGADGLPIPFKPKNPVIDGRRQIMLMRLKPTQDEWEAKSMLVKGEQYFNKFPQWDEKGCDLFRSAIEALQMGELPDFDELIKSQLEDDSQWGGGRRGRIGRKSPKANPGALMGMKK